MAQKVGLFLETGKQHANLRSSSAFGATLCGLFAATLPESVHHHSNGNRWRISYKTRSILLPEAVQQGKCGNLKFGVHIYKSVGLFFLVGSQDNHIPWPVLIRFDFDTFGVLWCYGTTFDLFGGCCCQCCSHILHTTQEFGKCTINVSRPGCFYYSFIATIVLF